MDLNHTRVICNRVSMFARFYENCTADERAFIRTLIYGLFENPIVNKYEEEE